MRKLKAIVVDAVGDKSKGDTAWTHWIDNNMDKIKVHPDTLQLKRSVGVDSASDPRDEYGPSTGSKSGNIYPYIRDKGAIRSLGAWPIHFVCLAGGVVK